MDLAFYTNFSNSLTQQEAQVSQLQTQISTGYTVQTPDQNPGAWESATVGQDQLAALSNDNNTQAAIQVQLGTVNDAYQSASNLFNNVQSILEQALNGTTSTQNLKALISQVGAAQTQLQAIGNTATTNGTYVFGGTRGSVPPFQTDATGNVLYLGDGGQSQAAITPDINASTIANGDAFVSALSGNGYSSVTATSTNAGTGQVLNLGPVSAATAAAFQTSSAPITLSFAAGSSSGLTYTATQGGVAIATGNFTSGQSLQLAGQDFQIAGTPASGDSFTISPSRPQTAFSLLQTVYSALNSSATTPAQVAQTNQILNNSLAGLAQYQQAVITAQAQNGVTLQAVANASTSNTNQTTQVQTAIQNATGVNTPVAIATLDETLTALQAAMKTFGDVQNLSLFQYI
jgi:flagellar hook-associated protein 3 FlgL